jgi:serine/threonine protein kinase
VSLGTLEYVAPEILFNKPLTTKSDMWAIGVCVFQMFVGYTPFFSAKKEKIIERIKSCDLEFDA